jgi:hypothetical protein
MSAHVQAADIPGQSYVAIIYDAHEVVCHVPLAIDDPAECRKYQRDLEVLGTVHRQLLDADEQPLTLNALAWTEVLGYANGRWTEGTVQIIEQRVVEGCTRWRLGVQASTTAPVQGGTLQLHVTGQVVVDEAKLGFAEVELAGEADPGAVSDFPAGTPPGRVMESRTVEPVSPRL